MQQVSGTLQRIVDDAVAQALQRLPPDELPQAAWEFAAGRAVAEKTRVLGCEAQVLRIEVAEANWRAQLGAMAAQYVARLRPLLAIERIEFEVAGPAQPTTAPKKQGFAAGYAAKDAAAGARQEKGTHEGHRKRRSLRRRPGQS